MYETAARNHVPFPCVCNAWSTYDPQAIINLENTLKVFIIFIFICLLYVYIIYLLLIYSLLLLL